MRRKIKPIDVDWTMDLARDVGKHLVSKDFKKKISGRDRGIWAPIESIAILMIVNDHLEKNGYILAKPEELVDKPE